MLRHLVRAAARDQRAPELEQPAAGDIDDRGMTHDQQLDRRTRALTEPRARAVDARSAIALAFLALFLVLPLAAVFVEAFAKGLGAYCDGDSRARRRSALELTLLAAGDRRAAQSGLRRRGGVGDRASSTFRGKSLLITLIDLPFAVSPVIAGLIFVLLFGRRAASARGFSITTSRSSSPCRASCWRRSS